MFNCYAIVWVGKDFALFKTEQAAWNMISLMRSNGLMGDETSDVQGRYISGAF